MSLSRKVRKGIFPSRHKGYFPVGRILILYPTALRPPNDVKFVVFRDRPIYTQQLKEVTFTRLARDRQVGVKSTTKK